METFLEDVVRLFSTQSYIDSFLSGFLMPLEISFAAIIIGFILGLIIALIRVAAPSPWLYIPKAICRIYTTIVRGTPMALQLFIMVFVIFAIRDFPQLLTAIIAFGLNSAAYSSEIFRSGILSVDKGQSEAGLSLGLPRRTVFWKIVFPQALKNSISPLGSEIVSVIKETAIVSMVGMYDLNMAAKDIGSGHNLASFIVPMFVAALFYLAIVYVIILIVNIIEKRLRRSDIR